MENISKSHVVMLCFLVCLLIITPFLSSNTRPTYLYFITNLLIIALGAESGLLSLLFSNKNISQDKTLPPPSSPNNSDVPHNHSIDQNETKDNLEKSTSSTIIDCDSKRDNGGYCYKLPTKSSSTPPSLFFIGNGGSNGDTHSKEEMAYVYDDGVEEEEDEVIGEISGQELYVKAEAFIGNFYKQLRLQRENSLKRIYGIYDKT